MVDRRDEDDLPLGLSRGFGRLAGAVSNAILEQLDTDAIVARIDIDGVVGRIDPNDLVARVDVNALLERVDVDRLLDRVDVDRLLDRVDVDRLVARIDVEEIVHRARIPEIVASSTGQVAGSALDLVRQQIVGLDVILGRGLARITGRDPATLPAGPTRLVGEVTGPVEVEGGDQPIADARRVSGHYAGPLSRLASHALDIAAATASWTAASAGITYILSGVFGLDLGRSARTGPLWVGLLVLWMLAYWWLSTAVAGRTPAMMLLGLRIVARDGRPLAPRRSLWRTLVLPISTVPFGLGFLGIVLDRERRALHDLAAGSAVVYDWGGREARVPSPLGDWLARHGTAGSA